MLALYQQAAATCPGLSWTILAAIGTIESDNGQSDLPGVHGGANAAGAVGIMSFEPSTFAADDQPVPPGGVNPPSPYDPTDAVFWRRPGCCAPTGRLKGPTSPVPSTPTTTRPVTSPKYWHWLRPTPPPPPRPPKRSRVTVRVPWRCRGRCRRSARHTCGAARRRVSGSIAQDSCRPPTPWRAFHSPEWRKTNTTPRRNCPGSRVRPGAGRSRVLRRQPGFHRPRRPLRRCGQWTERHGRCAVHGRRRAGRGLPGDGGCSVRQPALRRSDAASVR